MIIYSTLSMEEIFPDPSTETTNRAYLSINGKQVYAEQLADGSYQLLQLLSTDPQDFLNNDYQPGAYVSLS